ncbi:hypothetical protein RHMOL_Rhmol13G0149100 [Rhododendron molle]|uniref:Uncharacterized protein n=1 Tax=Rhododendron molle TaxID=49168 RepID=A0ACC0L8F2_RHOML|nr:hypothetical protein RHMOL_Rhmol13G0149100 [Rhododendron molle]
MAWLVNHRADNSYTSEVYKLSLATAINWIWRERNKRIFQGRGVSSSVLGGLVIEEVRACLCSWRGLRLCDGTRLLARSWSLSSRIFSL